MKIRKIQVQGFRNLDREIVEFSDRINCVFGKNASGKTNLLEAIYVLGHHKSFRKNTGFSQMVGIDSEAAEIIFRGHFGLGQRQRTLSLRMEGQGGQWSLDGNIVSRRPEIFYVLFINPFDSYLFHTTPNFRRDWIDRNISSLWPDYEGYLKNYNKLLKFKNHLLRTAPHGYQRQVAAMEEQMANVSFLIERKREEFLRELNPLFGESFREMFDEASRVQMVLESKLAHLDREGIIQLFRRSAKKDEALGYATCGVHLDDYGMFFNGIRGADFCSLGQQKNGPSGPCVCLCGPF